MEKYWGQRFFMFLIFNGSLFSCISEGEKKDHDKKNSKSFSSPIVCTSTEIIQEAKKYIAKEIYNKTIAGPFLWWAFFVSFVSK